MPFVVWSDMFCITVPYIDDQHKILLEITNKFYEDLKSGSSKDTSHETLNQLIKYAESHFRDEEEIMALTTYPAEEITEHKKIHEKLVDDIFKLHSDLTNGKELAMHDLDLFLNDWLIKHILLTDKKLVPYCTELHDYAAHKLKG